MRWPHSELLPVLWCTFFKYENLFLVLGFLDYKTVCILVCLELKSCSKKSVTSMKIMTDRTEERGWKYLVWLMSAPRLLICVTHSALIISRRTELQKNMREKKCFAIHRLREVQLFFPFFSFTLIFVSSEAEEWVKFEGSAQALCSIYCNLLSGWILVALLFNLMESSAKMKREPDCGLNLLWILAKVEFICCFILAWSPFQDFKSEQCLRLRNLDSNNNF